MKLRIKNFQILSDVELEFKKGITAIVGPSNSGKCIHEDSRIHTSLGYIKIKDVPNNGENVDGFSTCNFMVKDNQECTHFYSNGYSKMRTIKGNNFSLTGTLNHPVKIICDEGIIWRNIEDIHVGDYILLDKKINYLFNNIVNKPSGWGYKSKEYGYIIGSFLGDGNLKYDKKGNINAFQLLTFDDEIRDYLRKLTKDIFINKEYTRRGSVYNIFSVYKKKYISFLEREGLINKSGVKDIPEWVFRSNRDFITGLLSGYIDADGTFSGKDLSITSKDFILLKKVCELFHLEGLYPSLRERKVKYKNEYRTYYVLRVPKKELADVRGLCLKSNKRKQLNSLRSLDKFTIPRFKYLCNQIKDLYRPASKKERINNKSIFNLLYSFNKSHNFYYNTYLKVVNYFNSNRIKDIEDIRYNYTISKVTNIEDTEGISYDITVPSTKTFMANGLINHNTSILRALGCLINNSSEAKSYIKHGKDKTTVEIELEDKPKIKWIRTPKGANYEIEGEVHDKVGKSNLLDLISLDEFYRDQDSNDLINIQDEWSLLFPFQKTDSQMYKLFEDIFSINDSSVIFRKIKEDESLCKKELCNLNTELLRNKEKSVQLKEYLSSVDINILNKYRDDLSDLDNYISTINKDSDMVKEYLRKYDSLRKLKREEYDLNTLDEYISLDNDCNYIKSNEVFINFNIERTEYDLILFEDLMSLNTDCDTVLRYLKEYNSLKEDIKKYEEERESISERLRDVKTCPLCNQSLREGDSSWI